MRRSIQLVTLNKATIQRMVIDTLQPLLDHFDKFLILRGTAAHVGKSAWLEEAIAKDLGNLTIKQDKDIYSWWHYRARCEEVKIDISHHANMGSTPWSKRNAANVLAAKMMWWYQVEMNEKAPDLVLRSHNHTRASSGDNYPCFVDYLPAWTTKTEFAYRIGMEEVISDIGGMVYICEDGKFERRKYLFPPREARRVWNIKL
jgi:hypothetical protein